MQIKVVKFGGSSLADAAQFKKVYSIIKSDDSRRYVVPSAPGKRHKDDTKVTDMLYNCYEKAASGENVDEYFADIEKRYNEIIDSLKIDMDLSGEFELIKKSFAHKAGKDYAASRGEYLNGLILAEYLGFDFIDPAGCIFFKDNGTFDAERTNMTLADEMKKHDCAVIPGFYGSMPNDTIKTFSRGGSDITGSIVARAIGADLYENWTDVDGFLMADPRIIDSPKVIESITYRELRELSYMGATVLHEDAIFPVRFAGIPINIRNTNNPEAKGTMIVATSSKDDGHGVITGIAGKRGFSTVTVEKDMMNAEVGFGRRLLEVFENNDVCFEHLPSGIDTMSVVVSSAELYKNKDKVLNGIFKAVTPDSMTVEDKIALIAIVGRGMVEAKGTASRIFKAISDADINIKMIDQGSSELSIIIGITEEDFEKALKSIYNEFCL